MARLPIPGQDDGTWGNILNDYLSVEHNADGTQKDLSQSKVTNLTTDLATKVDSSRTVNSHPLSSDVTITKGDVGLGNVDDTTDANKPISIATQTALNLKANDSDVIKITGDQSATGVKAFQAVRVGRTWHDASSYASLSAAITAAGVGGGIALRPGVTYEVPSPGLALLANQHLKGGPGTVLKIPDGAVMNIISITNQSGIVIEDIEFDCNSANTVDGAPTVQAGIYVLSTNTNGCKGLKFRRLKFRNALKWLFRLNAATVDTHPLEFELEDIELSGAGTVCLRINLASRFAARNVRATGAGNQGMTIQGSHNFELDSACQFYGNADHGVTITDAYDFGVIGSRGYGNGVSVAGGSGIVLSRGCLQFRVIGTDTRNNHGPNLNIDVADAADISQLIDCMGVVMGNIAKGSVASEGIRLNRPSGVAVVGNVVTDNFVNGIVTNGRDLTFESNIITRNGKWGLQFEDPGGLPTGRHVVGPSNRVWGNNTRGGAGDINWAAVLDEPYGLRFFGKEPNGGRPTAVPVTPEGIHAALVTLGLIDS